MTDYKPIQCSIHDVLESFATLGTECEIERSVDGTTEVLRGRIADVFARDGAEFLAFVSTEGASEEIRLDRLIAVRELGS